MAFPYRPLTGLILLALTTGAVAEDGLGCRPPTVDEQAWMDEHLIIPDAIELNRTAIERINAERHTAGLPDVTITPVDDSQEVIGRTKTQRATGTPLSTRMVVRAAPAALPSVVDNSALDAFPPIGNQGGLGSCACFSTTYYTMTYMTARARNVDAKHGSNATRFSPKFCYNLINGGGDNGSWITTAFSAQQTHGVPTWAALPYDNDFLSWPTTAALWRNAIPSRMGEQGSISGVDTATGLADLKRLLTNGYVLNFATDIYGWQWTTLGNDPSTTTDDAFVGQKVCHWYQTNSSGHAMTAVGYNDNLWVDLNGNGVVDPGEKGALHIINQWGTGWQNGGHAWLMYDALKATSAVSGWTGGTSRTGAWWYNAAYWINARPAHQPTVLGEFTLNTAKRSQMSLALGISSTSATTPSKLFSALQNEGGEYAFNGTTTAADATFVLDFTDLLPAGTQRCYLKTYDGIASDPCTVKSFAVTDGSGTVLASATTTVPAGGLPKAADASTVFAWTDVVTSDVIAPAAITDLASTYVAPTAITLTWTATGDNGPTGTATSYDVRYANAPITAGTWAAATTVSGEPTPKASGGHETFQITGLGAGATWYIAVVATDEAGNASAISNVLTETTPALLAISSPTTLPDASISVAYATTLTATGGSGSRTWSTVDGWVELDPGTSAVAATGSARGWRADDTLWTYTFPTGFTFPFAGSARSSVSVSSNGYLTFDGVKKYEAGTNSQFMAAPMIAVCWRDLNTAGSGQAGEDVYISETSDAVIIRWLAEIYGEATPIDAQVTLGRDGSIAMAWRLPGSGFYIGVSDGDSNHWKLSALASTTITAGTRRSWSTAAWPAGLNLDANTGAITGSLASGGVRHCGVLVTDSGYPAQVATASLTLHVGTPAITSAATATGQVGTPFSYQITATESPTSYAASSLPAGLTCSAAGLISGTPTTAGTTSASVSATNAIGSTSGLLAITIAPHAPVLTLAPTATAQVGVPFSLQLTANYQPTGFAVSGLPDGLSCSPTGLITGSILHVGTADVVITASNAAGSDQVTVRLTANAAPAPAATSETTGGGSGGGCGAGTAAIVLGASLALTGLGRRRSHSRKNP